MGWTAGADVSTGDLITAAQWNNFLGAAGSLEYIYDNVGLEIWAPATSQYDDVAGYEAVVSRAAVGGHPVVRCAEALDFAYMSFIVPADYNAITTAAILVIPRVTDSVANWDIFAHYGAVGQDWDNHYENDVAATYNVTNDILFHVDCSGILTSLAANDRVGISLKLSDANDDVDVVGFYMKYARV